MRIFPWLKLLLVVDSSKQNSENQAEVTVKWSQVPTVKLNAVMSAFMVLLLKCHKGEPNNLAQFCLTVFYWCSKSRHYMCSESFSGRKPGWKWIVILKNETIFFFVLCLDELIKTLIMIYSPFGNSLDILILVFYKLILCLTKVVRFNVGQC